MMHLDNISLMLDYRYPEEDLVDLQRCDLEDIVRFDEPPLGRILTKVAAVYLGALLVAMILL